MPEESNTKIDSAWNPLTILIVSLICTPLPGGILHALNYRRLGRPEQVRSSLITNILLSLFVVLVGFKIQMVAIPNFQLKLLGVFLSVAVSVYFYRTQILLFRSQLRHGKSGGGWLIPALVGVLGLGLLIGVSYGLEYLLLKEFKRGISLVDAGDFKAAEKIFLRYQESDPTMADAYFNLAIVYMNSGQDEKAAHELEKFLRISPFDEEARKMLQSLRKEGITKTRDADAQK